MVVVTRNKSAKMEKLEFEANCLKKLYKAKLKEIVELNQEEAMHGREK